MLSSNSINNPLILNENLDGEQSIEQSIEQIVPEEVSIYTLASEEYKCKINTSIASLIRANGLCEHGGSLDFVKDYNGKISAYLSNGLAPIEGEVVEEGELEEEEVDNPVAIEDGVSSLDGLVDSNGILKGFVTPELLIERHEELYGDVNLESKIDEEEGKGISIPFNGTQSLDTALREIEIDYNNKLALFREERRDRLFFTFVGGLIGGGISVCIKITDLGPDKISGVPLIMFVLCRVVSIYSFLSGASGCFSEISAFINNILGEPCLSTNKLRSRTLDEKKLQQDKCNPAYLDPRDLSNNSCATTFRAYGESARAKDEFDNNRLRSVAPYAHAMER